MSESFKMLESLEINLSKEKGFFVISCTQTAAALIVWGVFKGSPFVGLDFATEVAGIGAFCWRLGEGFD